MPFVHAEVAVLVVEDFRRVFEPGENFRNDAAEIAEMPPYAVEPAFDRVGRALWASDACEHGQPVPCRPDTQELAGAPVLGYVADFAIPDLSQKLQPVMPL